MQEISTQADFETWLNNTDRAPAAIRQLDLNDFAAAICESRFLHSIFLSCQMAPSVAGHITCTGGVVIPDLYGFKFSVHRAKLYSVEELFAGFDVTDPRGYESTYDYKIYLQYCQQGKKPVFIDTSLARRLHDHSITEALDEEIAGRDVVAVMGGHSMQRSDPFYTSVALISRELTQAGFLLVSGGGPGAMEATHLGAYFAARSEEELHAAIDILKVRPVGAEVGREYADADWLHRAWKVRQQFPLTKEMKPQCKSIGVPTWLYGHEPPAPFATHIAKYFANSVREDGLLAMASHGVIFAPGSAGTTQEVFQDAAQNHYATQHLLSPMILFGKEHWTGKLPVWPLLNALAGGKDYHELIAITNSAAEVVQQIRNYDPARYRRE